MTISLPVVKKLVRNQIPSVIKSDGRVPAFTLETDHNVRRGLLHSKLNEEWHEFVFARSASDKIEELADLIEVVFAAAQLDDININDLLTVAAQKRSELGGFDNYVVLTIPVPQKEE